MQLEFRETRLHDQWRDAHGGEPVPADVASGRIRSWECIYDAQVVGHCAGDLETGEILGLSVLPAYQAKGIARRLLSFVVDWLRSAGTRRIWLAAPSDPVLRAYGFYRALGWKPTGEPASEGSEILELRADC
jgi:GNAT superfamily N-acetyltransferase